MSAAYGAKKVRSEMAKKDEDDEYHPGEEDMFLQSSEEEEKEPEPEKKEKRKRSVSPYYFPPTPPKPMESQTQQEKAQEMLDNSECPCGYERGSKSATSFIQHVQGRKPNEKDGRPGTRPCPKAMEDREFWVMYRRGRLSRGANLKDIPE